MYMHMHIDINIYVHVHINKYVHVHVHKYTHTCTCTCVCVYEHIDCMEAYLTTFRIIILTSWVRDTHLVHVPPADFYTDIL